MSIARELSVRFTVQEFLSWAPDDGHRYELVDGQPRAMAPGSTIHGFLQNELGSLIRDHLRRNHSKCEVIANPGVVPRLLTARNFRIPDLGVTSSRFLSPSNQADTWSNVWTYTSLALADFPPSAAAANCNNPSQCVRSTPVSWTPNQSRRPSRPARYIRSVRKPGHPR
jgi:hypothetical protein